MSSIEVYGPYWVCQDCLIFIANGDLPEDDKARTRVLAAFEDIEPEDTWVAAGECEEHGYEDTEHCAEYGCYSQEFSWRTCGCCQSGLGGSRHIASVLHSVN